MPLIHQVTVSQLVDSIKVEGRIKGADNLDVTILAIINELLLAHIQTERYSELIIRNVAITLVAAQGDYALPANFANIKKVYFTRSGGVRRVLNFKGDYVEQSRDGSEPKYFELNAGGITIFPWAGILTTDTLTIDYWSLPNMLILTDTFPVAKLLPVIKREAIARAHKFNKDYNASDRFEASAASTGQGEQTQENNSDV